ncbi:hypothetical protein OH77DRAFT_1398804 [Trametes cingulata]|nr:hypothetical protein OH77DRAFT_1398804 [Trametes cingulata]
MRQRGVSDEDQRFRRALTNLRVKSCTEEDRALFRSRIVAQGNARGLECDWRKFDEVSIITARNSHRDAINEVGSRLFASRRGKSLHTFRSIDRWSSTERNDDSVRQDQREAMNSFDPARSSNQIHPDIQNILWDIPPCMTDHHAGTLKLCKGMPVILKNNEATEICATNGAEGVIYDWQAQVRETGEEVLDVLFVRLTNPPKDVRVEGLPVNVVPIPRTKIRVKCTLPTGVRHVYIDREQVMVLPNFAMSDFASQGRTRKYNPCHLSYCRTSQSLYTCLSRCSSLEGTVILGRFDESKMVGGLPKALRREFLEFEILDDISKREYEGSLPAGIPRAYRSEAIRVFLSKMGDSYMPPHVHPALNWETYYTHREEDIPTAWRVVSKRRPKKSTKRKRSSRNGQSEQAEDESEPRKRRRLTTGESSRVPLTRGSVLRGLAWDPVNWSCAYDSLLTVLWNIYCEDRDQFVAKMSSLTASMDVLIACFSNVNRDMSNLEGQRDTFRDALAGIDGVRFPRSGRCLVAVSDIMEELLKRDGGYGYRGMRCVSCGRVQRGGREIGSVFSSGLLYRQIAGEPTTTCAYCGGLGMASVIGECVPFVICLELYPASGRPHVWLDRSFHMSMNSVTRYWKLRGLIYWGANHFTCRFVDHNGMVWYHDGVSCGQNCEVEGQVGEVDLLEARGRSLSHLVYYCS